MYTARQPSVYRVFAVFGLVMLLLLFARPTLVEAGSPGKGTVPQGATSAESNCGAVLFQLGDVGVTRIFYATDDATVKESTPNIMYGSSWSLEVGRLAGKEVQSLVRFDLSSVPDGARVEEAHLQLYKMNATAAPGLDASSVANLVWVHRNHIRIPGPQWSEDWVTWLSKPGTYSSDQGALVVQGPAKWYELHVTAAVREWLEAGSPANGFTLKGDGVTDWPALAQFASRDNGSGNGPRLVVDYTVPAEPTYLPLVLRE